MNRNVTQCSAATVGIITAPPLLGTPALGQRTKKRVTSARNTKAHRARERRGRTLVKTTPRKQKLLEAIHEFAFSPHANSFPEIRRDLERVRSGCETWPHDKEMIGRILTVVVVDEWVDRWLKNIL